jgi:hypothetical protein
MNRRGLTLFMLPKYSQIWKSPELSAHPHRSATKRYVKWVGFLSRNRAGVENRPGVTFRKLPHWPHLVNDWAWTPGPSTPWTQCPQRQFWPKWADFKQLIGR